MTSLTFRTGTLKMSAVEGLRYLMLKASKSVIETRTGSQFSLSAYYASASAEGKELLQLRSLSLLISSLSSVQNVRTAYKE